MLHVITCRCQLSRRVMIPETVDGLVVPVALSPTRIALSVPPEAEQERMRATGQVIDEPFEEGPS